MAEYTDEYIIDTTVKGAEKAEKQLDDIADATNKASDAGDEYTETLGDMAKEAEIFGVSLNGLVGGFKNSIGAIKNSVSGLKAFKVALASTGIGLLVVALGSLVAWLKNSQEGMNLLNDAMAVVGATIQEITGVLTKLGGAIVKVFKGDFKGAIDDASKSMDGFVDNIKNAVTQTLALEQQIRALEMAQGRSNVLTAVANQEIAKNKQTIEDVNASTQSRIDLAERNLELIGQIAEQEEQLAFDALEAERQRIKLYNEAHGLNETLLADQLILRELEAQVIETQTVAFEREIEFKNKLNELNLIRAEELHAQSMQNQQDMETERVLEIQKVASDVDINQQGLDAMNASLKAYYKEKQKQRDADAKLAQQNAEIEFQMGADLAGALAGLAGQDTILGKSLAIVQASMNTSVAITKALGAPTLVQRILGVAFATATGLKAVRDITSTPIPQVSINTSTPFGDGGMIHGHSHDHPTGGTWVLAEGGEAVINKRSMSIPWVRKQASYLNTLGGGVPFMERGGVVPQTEMVNPFINMERALASAQTVLVLDDLQRAQQGEFVTRVATTL